MKEEFRAVIELLHIQKNKKETNISSIEILDLIKAFDSYPFNARHSISISMEMLYI